MLLKHIFAGAVLLGTVSMPAQERTRSQTLRDTDELTVQHADCSFFVDRDRYRRRAADDPANFSAGAVAMQVAARLGATDYTVAVAARKLTDQALAAGVSGSIIDKYIFAKLEAEGVKPADRINDYEFIRRATLDLTGRIPIADRVLSFVAETAADKRAKLVDELLASPVWTDKWTYYLGDRLKNTANMRSTGTNRQPQGREAFNKWIRDSLTSGKGYDRMVHEMIATKGTNSWEQGEVNWLIGGRVTGGPAQDIYDQEAANIADTFLGITHVNCVLCHNGRYHLDSLSAWGRTATRSQMWGLPAFLAKTTMSVVRVPNAANNPNIYYWTLVDNPRAVDYALNTTTGNRPARQPIGSMRNVPPVYPFSGRGPRPGEDYREALAREVTTDFQFARASVNFIWKEFFGRGIVNPVNQFDLARLDPDKPLTDCPENTPCGLQPSHPELLRDLARDFADGGYNMRDLMRKIVNSESYQLSARYSGEWKPSYEALFARRLPRRLWGEEAADSIALASNVITPFTYRLDETTTPRVNWAIQIPEPSLLTGSFIPAFINGNRDDEERRPDGAVQQALGLMNDGYISTRIRATGTGATASLLQQAMLQSGNNDNDLVNRLFLAVLSRPPGEAERTVAMRVLQTARGANRTDRASTLLWALFNKVDFIFNY